MALQRRSFNSLPSLLQTNRNNLELAVTDDLLYEPEQADFVSGFIGDTSKLSDQDLARTPKLLENSAIQQKYQFSVGVAQFDTDSQTFISGAFYDDLLNHLALNGAIIDDPNRLFSAYYYAWTPPIDYDKIVNPARYFWTGPGTASLNGEYITKEAAGSQTILHQYDGTTLVSNSVTIVDGLPGSGTLNEIVEDVSTINRYLYQWNGISWGLVNFQVSAYTKITAAYHTNDFVYVCRTGVHFNRPVVWVYRPAIGRWISIPVVINVNHPETPQLGMIWEDATVPPARILRIYDGNQWQTLDTGTLDPYTGESLTYTVGAGPSGTPTGTTYLFDTRDLTSVDTWSARNWWRTLTDLSLSDQAVHDLHQASRPIIEFWGNLEPASGVTRTSRDQFPTFNLYAVSPTTFEIVDINPTNFPGLDTSGGSYVGGSIVSTIFNYAPGTGTPDSILGFAYQFGTDGTPLFYLDLERLTITVNGSPLVGYRYFKDTSTGFVHSIWERTGQVLLQTTDSDGLYDIPKNLKFNPDHIVTTSVSRADYINHFASVIKSQTDFSGTPYGVNNFRYTPKDLTLNATMIDPEESLQRVMSVLQTNRIDIPDAIRQMSRDYNKVMARFLAQLNTYWNDGTLSTVNDTLTVTTTQATDAVLTQIFLNRNSEFSYYYSVMGTYVETRIVGGILDIFDTTPLPIFIPNSSAQIGASPPYVPEVFTDDDGNSKIRGHDGSLIPAYGDARDDVIIDLETRFYNSVPDYMKTETTTFSGRFSSTFHLDDYYGNLTPILTAGTVVEIVADYTSIFSPVTNDRLYSSNQQVYATWNGTKWVTKDASVNDVFFNSDDGFYYIFNGFYAKQIITFNRDFNFDYSENDFRAVIQREFERWIVVHNLDFTTNDDFDPNDIFTWNFASAGIEGNWRGIYRRIYRTIRPHSHPWEVVGYSVRPDWWFTSYVPTSYASDGTPRYANSHSMWTDFQSGIVNPLSGLTFLSHAMVGPIPVDVVGELLDPIAAGVVDEQALTPSSLGDDWAYGDGAPVEQSFYNSYYYQFAVALAGYLMKTAIFVDRTWSEFYRQIGSTGTNILWNHPHTVFNDTLTRPQAADVDSHLSLDSNGDVVTNPGLNSWIAEYTNIIGLSANNDFDKAIKQCQAALGWKTSGFINAKRTKIELLSGDEVPTEDINVVLHQGPSVNEYFQSGIIIVRDTDGFRVFGTDVLNSYFTVDLGAKPISGGSIETQESFDYGYYLDTATIVLGGGDYLVNDIITLVGGTSTTAATLKVSAVDSNGSVTAFTIEDVGNYITKPDNPLQVTGGSGKYLQISASWLLTSRTFTTTNLTIPPSTNDTATFAILINDFKVASKFITRLDATSFSIDPVLILNPGDDIVASVVTTVSNPSTQLGSFTVNGTQITYFATGTGVLVNYPYGTLFRTLSDVVNMLVGYGRYLSQKGWIFQRLTNGLLRDWLGAAKTFAQWSTDLTKKTNGNPALMKGQIFQYSVMGRQAQFNAPFGMVLGIEEIRNGSYGVVDVNSKPIRANHLNVISTGGDITVTSDDTDIFGLRLYLSEVQHVVFFPNTTTFNDVIYEPAFGLAQDAVVVDTYRTTNWAGRMEAPGFLISGGNLLPNWEKQVNDITRYYNRFNPPDDPILTGMARALFGYVPQGYMDELSIDDRNQFNFFHGSLKAKGTFQPYEAFIRGTTIGTDNVNISEDWAWKFARFGDHRKVTVLFTINEHDFVDVYQAIRFDELTFSYTFTGDESTTCFTVPQRFEPPKAVVQIDGDLQAYGIDYVMNAVASGYDVCFTIAPLRGTIITVSLNDTLVQSIQDSVYNPTSGDSFITVAEPVRTNNILLSVNGDIAVGGTDYSASLNTIYVPSGDETYGLIFQGLGEDIFNQLSYSGDGFTTEFSTMLSGQSLNTVMVAVNGMLKAPGVDYTIDNISTPPIGLVQMVSTPALNDNVFIIAVNNPSLTRTNFTTYVGNGSQTLFTVPGISLTTYRQVLVSIDGVIQIGPVLGQTVPNTYVVTSGGVKFNTAPTTGAVVNIYVFLAAVTDEIAPLEDDRVIHIPQFSPPNNDDRWVIPPQQDLYRDEPYSFPVLKSGLVDFNKYLYTAAIVDQNAVAPAVTLFHWDPARGLHEPLALSLTDYKIPYDPARYNNGPLAEAANGLVWGESQVGQVWWDTSVATYSDYESYLPDYMKVTREWGKLKYFTATITRENEVVTVTTYDPKTGSITNHGLLDGQIVIISGADQPTYNGTFAITLGTTYDFTFIVNDIVDTPGTGNIIVQIGLINCYEWVASPVPPSSWDTFVTSQTGFNIYSGTVLNPDNASYATREVWDINENSTTTYYFWVQSNTRLIPGKEMSVKDIAGRLRTPALYEVPYFGIIDSSTMFVFAGDTIPLDDYAIEITYYWYEMPQHVEWILFGENDDFATVPQLVTDKLLDSMLGTDTHDNPVPNITLSNDEKYGTCFFPAQTVFQDVDQAITIYVDAVNSLMTGIDIDTISTIFGTLSLVDEYSNSNPDGYWQRETWWQSANYGYRLDAVTIFTGGTGYAVDDIITLIGGTFNGAAKLRVKTVDDVGAVTAVSIFNGGLYSISPDSPILTTGGSGSGLEVDGSWQLTDHSIGQISDHIVYDTVLTVTELDFLTDEALYAEGDIVKVIQSDKVDPWDASQVAAYYRYDGSNWNVVGIDHHTFSINANIVSDAAIFRDFFQNLGENISKIQMNRILFAVLYEMIRQNADCDWFFKTSYIDLHSTQDIPITPYVFPDQATAIKEAILNLKPFRTKLRDEVVTYRLPDEDIAVGIQESQINRDTLIFDRVACNLNDENSWDTIPWDATVTYPDVDSVTLTFTGTGVQRCFTIPEAVPSEELFVFVNGHLSIPTVDYLFDPVSFSLCFNVAPNLGDIITVVIDGPYEYFGNFEWTFLGNSVTDSEVLPDRVAETVVGNVFSNWNGVHQIPTTDYIIQVTSDTEVVYNSVPSSEIVVNGTAFGGVISDIFIETSYTGDGTTQAFNATIGDQTLDTVIVLVDGIWQTPGTIYVIDNITASPNSLISFISAPANGSNITIYAVATPDWVDCGTFIFTGDGSTNTFAISGLDDPVPPMIFANIEGIQQNQDHGDFTVNSTGIVFAQTPRNGADIAIFVLWTGIGDKLAGSAFPQTIQWDWAFWNYADLGRKEYDFGGFFIGNDITDSFTVPIPQQSSLLYSIVVKFFKNGVLTSLSDLGLTMTVTKLATGVVVFLSDSLPSDTYGALYVSRGFFEGLKPTFGFQNPDGIVFAPTESSYEHFFARLISATFDPSVDMVGCPDNSPEERIQTTVDDLWTIAVKVYVQVFPELQTMSLIGNEAISEIGDFAFFIDNNPSLLGRQVTAHAGDFLVMLQPPPFDLVGLDVTAMAGDFAFEISDSLSGQESITETGVFDFLIDTNPSLSGVEAFSEFSDFGRDANVALASVQAAAVVGDFTFGFRMVGLSSSSERGSFVPTIDYSLVGVEAIVSGGVIFVEVDIPVVGVTATSEFGTFDFQEDNNPDLTSLAALTSTGSFVVDIDDDEDVSGVEAVSDFGILGIEIGILSGVAATAEFGTLDFQEDTNPELPGVQAVAASPSVLAINYGRGAVATSHAGQLIPTVIFTLPSVGTTAQTGTMHPSPIILSITGRQANAQAGNISTTVSF